MYINHLTLATGHLSRIQRGDVAGETLARVAPWLAVLVASGAHQPLPASAFGQYSAGAVVQAGALILTVYGPGGAPLVSLGVAKRSRQTQALWRALTVDFLPVKEGLTPPQEPWCAVVLWPSLAADPGAMQWLGDFERCIAWAWCTRAINDESAE